jgi:heme oxygenase (staphylobilin-producing)
MAWVAVNRIQVENPAEADQLVEAFRHRSGKVDLQPGFLSFELWREEGGREVSVVTRWVRREDFLAWVESPAFRHAHARASESPGAGNGMVYEVALGSEPAAGEGRKSAEARD